jgi:asparagine synthase (glutamine-hydrolysing)
VAGALVDDPLDELRYLDTAVTLPDDMLVKVDRASMHWGLEARVPLLDPAVMAWAWAQPRDALVQHGRGKQPLRALLARLLPAELTAGPKRGFDPPLAQWLRGPLRRWADERFAPDRLDATGWLDPVPVRRLWEAHLSGRANHDYRLWTVLSFVTWSERWRQ